MMKNEIIRSQFRLPKDIHDTLSELAAASGRSINAEIIFQLQRSLENLNSTESNPITDEHKLELILTYEVWENEEGHDVPRIKRYPAFRKADSFKELTLRYPILTILDEHKIKEIIEASNKYVNRSIFVVDKREPEIMRKLAHERKKADVLLAYLKWCRLERLDHKSQQVMASFCKKYNKSKEPNIPVIDSSFLSELYYSWAEEFNDALGNISKGSYFDEIIQEVNQMKSHQNKIYEQINELKDELLALRVKCA